MTDHDDECWFCDGSRWHLGLPCPACNHHPMPDPPEKQATDGRKVITDD